MGGAVHCEGMEHHIHVDAVALVTGLMIFLGLCYVAFVNFSSNFKEIVPTVMQIVFDKLSKDEPTDGSNSLGHKMGKVLFAGMPNAVNESVTSLLKSEEFRSETAEVMSQLLRDEKNVSVATQTLLDAV